MRLRWVSIPPLPVLVHVTSYQVVATPSLKSLSHVPAVGWSDIYSMALRQLDGESASGICNVVKGPPRTIVVHPRRYRIKVEATERVCPREKGYPRDVTKNPFGVRESLVAISAIRGPCSAAVGTYAYRRVAAAVGWASTHHATYEKENLQKQTPLPMRHPASLEIVARLTL